MRLRVEVIEALRHLDARRPDRCVEHDRAVADPDRVDRDRRGGTGAISFPLLLLDKAAERPGVPFAAQMDHRLVESNAVDRQPTGDQLKHVVIDADVLHGDDRAAVQRHRDVLELETEEQVATQPLDERAIQVLVACATMYPGASA